ncbi:hypothetical protein [Arcobacter sp. YIC-310]|uniref:hypothetical protein n=1 Tax=Arcobacter sp. YIC-310 TaxID=3376632 RepID=UPI003C1952AA
MFNAEMGKFNSYMKRSYPIGYNSDGTLKDLRNYYDNNPNYTKKDVVNILDKVADTGAALVIAGAVAKKPLVISIGEGIDITATTFKIILTDRVLQPYEIYNEYAPLQFTITPLK